MKSLRRVQQSMSNPIKSHSQQEVGLAHAPAGPCIRNKKAYAFF